MGEQPSRTLVVLYSPVALFGLAAIAGGAIVRDPQIIVAGVLAVLMYLSIFPQLRQIAPFQVTAGQLLSVLALLWLIEIVVKGLLGRGLDPFEIALFGVLLLPLIVVGIRRWWVHRGD